MCGSCLGHSLFQQDTFRIGWPGLERFAKPRSSYYRHGGLTPRRSPNRGFLRKASVQPRPPDLKQALNLRSLPLFLAVTARFANMPTIAFDLHETPG